MATVVALLVVCALQALVVLQAILAHFDSFLTVSEMQRRGIQQGLPLVWHLGMWGDLILISPLVGIIVARYSQLWSWTAVVVALALSLMATVVLAWLYTLGEVPGSHVHHHQTTLAGYFHLAYMVVAIAVFLLLYFFTPGLSRPFAVVTSVLLVAHVSLGTHLALGVIKRIAGLPWYPHEPLSDPTAWLQVTAVGVALAWRTSQVG